MSDCCKLVGNFPIAKKGIISVNVSSNTEIVRVGDELVVGPTIGTISVSGYAKSSIHIGCPGRASVSIPWVRRYDCDKNELHFIFAGAGSSSIAGDVDGLASITEGIARTYTILSANAGSGPATLYTEEKQSDGYGLSFTGSPLAFATTDEGGAEISDPFGMEVGTLYLQNFNLSMVPGQVPVANYSFLFKITE